MAVRDFDPSELDLSGFEVVSEPDWSSQTFDPSQFDTSNFEVVSEPVQQRESGAALRLRQQAQWEAEQQPDQSTWLERLALGAGQGVRGLESAAGGLFNLAGLTGAGRALQANARAGQAELADTSATLAGQNPNVWRDVAENWGSMATQQIPSIAAAALTRNPRAAAVVAGLQSAGSVQDAAEQAYEAQGMAPDAATARARIPALTSGAITGALTALMPGGTERLASMMFAGPAARNAAREGVFGVAKRIFGEALREAPEEMLDQLGQGAVARFSYDPEKPLEEILMEAWEAGGWGAGTAGAVGTLGAGINAIDRAASRAPEQQTGVNLRQPVSPPLPPPAAPLTQADIDEANRANSIAQLQFAEQQRLGQNAATFDPSQFEVVSEPPPTEAPILTRNASGILTDAQGNVYDDNGQIATSALTYRNGSWVQVGKPASAVRPAADAVGGGLQQLSEATAQRVPETTQETPEGSQAVPEHTMPAKPGDEIKSSFVGRTVSFIQRSRDGISTFKSSVKVTAVKRSSNTRGGSQTVEVFFDDGTSFGTNAGQQSDGRVIPIEKAIETAISRKSDDGRFTIDSEISEVPKRPVEAIHPTLWRPYRRMLISGMQSRSMDLSPADFQGQEATLQSMLGPQAPTWAQLSEAGVVQATLNPNGTVNVRVAPPGGLVPPTVAPPPAQPETIAPIPETTPPVSETIAPKGDAAVRSGLPVAPEVLADYPELSKQSALAAPAPPPNPEKVRIVSQAVSEWARTQGVPFQLRITPAADQSGGVTEMGSRLGNVISAAENADEKVLPHEISHIVFDGLTDEVKATIEAARRSLVTPGMDQRIAAGQMTSAEFQAAGLPIEQYPLSNPSEFLAHAFSDKFAQQALDKAAPGLMAKLKVWVAEIWRTVKRALNLGNEMDRVVQDLIDGKLKFDPAVAAQQESKVRQASLVHTAREGQLEIEQSRTALERQQAAESFLGQSGTLVDLLEKHGGTSGKFNFTNLSQIRDLGQAWNNGQRENYQQLKARLTDAYQKNRLGSEAMHQVLKMAEKLQALIADRTTARAELNGPKIRKLTRRAQAAALSALSHEQFERTSKAIYNAAVKDVTAAMKDKAHTDLELAELQGQRHQIIEASQSSKAMAEQVLPDMVSVLSSSEQGRAALFTGRGGAREILSIYKDLKQSTRQPLHNENLLKWASYLLSKAPDLRDAVHAANLSRQTGLMSQLTGFQKQFADDLQQRPVQTMKRALRETAKVASDATGAEFLFKQYQKELLKEVGPMIQRIDNGDIAERVMQDPDFTAYRNEVLRDSSYIGDKPAMPFKASADAEGVIVTPETGMKVGIGYDTLPASQAEATKRYKEYLAAEDEMDRWLLNPANANDWSRRLKVEMDLRMLRAYYANQTFIRPEARVEHGPAFTVANLAADRSGSRMAGMLRKANAQLVKMQFYSRSWFNRWAFGMTARHANAMKSHGIKWGFGTGVSQLEAHKQYTEQVFRELTGLWRGRGSGHGPQAGDVLSSGVTVTPQDMEALRNQTAGVRDGIKLVENHDVQFTKEGKEATGLEKDVYRKTVEFGEYQLPTRFRDDLKVGGSNVDKAFKAYAEALQSDPQAAAAAKAELKAAIDAIWPLIGRAMLTHRKGKFASATPLDGVGQAFDQVAPMFVANPMAVGNLDSTAQQLAQYSTLTADEATDVMLNEFGRMISRWSSKANEGSGVVAGAKAGDTKNSFTEASGEALAPWVFYDTGFQTGDDVQSFATSMMSRSIDNVENGFTAVAEDLKRQESELTIRTAVLRAQGKANAKALAQEENELQRANGETYDNWEHLSQRQAMISGILNMLKNPDAIGSDFDFAFDRTAGAVVGSLVGNFKTTMRNVSGAYMGWKLYSMGVHPLKAALQGLGFTSSEIAKIALSLAYSGAIKSPLYLIRGLARGVGPLFKGELREAWRLALRDVINELSQTSMLRVPSIKRMVDAGAMILPDKVAEFDNQMRVGLLTRGRFTERHPEGVWKAWDYLLAAFEGTILPVVNAAFPMAGDAATNAAMFNYVRHPYGPVKTQEKNLRRVYAEMKSGAPRYRVFDFAHPNAEGNRLTHQELGMTADGLSKQRQFFENAGMSFDEEAARFMGELDKQNPNAQFLSDPQRTQVASTLIDRMNRETIANAPLAIKSRNAFVKLVRPLFGFNARQFASMFSEFSLPQFVEGQKPVSASDLRQQAVARYTRMAGSVLAGVALISFFGELRDQEIARMIARYFYNTESDQKWPWEQPTTERKLANFGRIAMEAAPLVGAIANTVIPQNSPARASYDPSVVLASVAKNIGDYISGAVQSGDPRFGLAEVINRLVPDAKIVVNRLPAVEGRKQASNAVAEIKRFSPPEAVRKPYRGGGADVNEANPAKQRMENAAQRRDRAGFLRAANEVYQVNLRMGKKPDDARKAVQSYWRGRSPDSRALTRRLTPQENANMLRDAGDLAAEIQTARQNWAQAGAMIGVHQRQGTTNRVSLRAPSLSRLGRGMARY